MPKPARLPTFSRVLTAVLIASAAAISFAPRSAHAQELAGCWDGTWVNWHDPFKGRMRGRITKCDDVHYQAEFWGIALVVIPYRYTTTLTVSHVEDGKTYFHGSDFLRIWGGYTICGYICGDKMYARYEKCKGDGGGCLEMCRTCCCGKCCCR